jgi:hypothetical protein
MFLTLPSRPVSKSLARLAVLISSGRPPGGPLSEWCVIRPKPSFERKIEPRAQRKEDRRPGDLSNAVIGSRQQLVYSPQPYRVATLRALQRQRALHPRRAGTFARGCPPLADGARSSCLPGFMPPRCQCKLN